jgi:hypothetical protein
MGSKLVLSECELFGLPLQSQRQLAPQVSPQVRKADLSPLLAAYVESPDKTRASAFLAGQEGGLVPALSCLCRATQLN